MIRLYRPKQDGQRERGIGAPVAGWPWLEEWDSFAEGHILVTRAIREHNAWHAQSALAFLSLDEYHHAYSDPQIDINLENRREVTPKTA